MTKFHDDPERVRECSENTTRDGSAPKRSGFDSVRVRDRGRDGDDVFLVGEGVRERPFVTVGLMVCDGVSDPFDRVTIEEFD